MRARPRGGELPGTGTGTSTGTTGRRRGAAPLACWAALWLLLAASPARGDEATPASPEAVRGETRLFEWVHVDPDDAVFEDPRDGFLLVTTERSHGVTTIDEARLNRRGELVERTVTARDAAGLLSLDEVLPGGARRRLERREGYLLVTRLGPGGDLASPLPPPGETVVTGIATLADGLKGGPLPRVVRTTHLSMESEDRGATTTATVRPPAAGERWPTGTASVVEEIQPVGPDAWAGMRVALDAEGRILAAERWWRPDRIGYNGNEGYAQLLLRAVDPPIAGAPEGRDLLAVARGSLGAKPLAPPPSDAEVAKLPAALDAAWLDDLRALEWLRNGWASPPAERMNRPAPETLEMVRQLAVSTGFAPILTRLEARMASADAAERYLAWRHVEALGGGRIGPERARRLAMLETALLDASDHVRSRAAEHLRRRAADAPLEPLCARLVAKDGLFGARGAPAMEALVRAGHAPTIARLVAIPPSDPSHGRAIQALADAPDLSAPGLRATLEQAAAPWESDHPGGVARQALAARGALPETTVAAGLAHTQPRIRREVAGLLDLARDPRAVHAWLSLASLPAGEVGDVGAMTAEHAWTAARATLARRPLAETLAFLGSAYREEAVAALVSRGDPAAVTPLLEAGLVTAAAHIAAGGRESRGPMDFARQRWGHMVAPVVPITLESWKARLAKDPALAARAVPPSAEEVSRAATLHRVETWRKPVPKDDATCPPETRAPAPGVTTPPSVAWGFWIGGVQLPIPGTRMAIVLVLDASYAAPEGKLEGHALVDTVKAAIDILPEEAALNLAAAGPQRLFRDAPRVADAREKARMKAWIDGLEPKGGADPSAALRGALKTPGVRAIVLVSGSPLANDDGLRVVAQEAKAQGVRIHGFVASHARGREDVEAPLRGAAGLSGGVFVREGE